MDYGTILILLLGGGTGFLAFLSYFEGKHEKHEKEARMKESNIIAKAA